MNTRRKSSGAFGSHWESEDGVLWGNARAGARAGSALSAENTTDLGDAMFNRNGQARSRSPEDLYGGMRAVTLESGRRGDLLRHGGHPDVYGVLVDIGQSNGYAAIAALSNGTASLYTESGGPVGMFKGPAAQRMIRELLTTAQAYLDFFSLRDDGRRPPVGITRLHVVDGAAGRAADVPTEAFWGRADDPLMPVILRVQEVLHGIRTGGAG